MPLASVSGTATTYVDNGIVIDPYGRTSDPNIFAAGDCANYFDRRYGTRLRLESVPSAVEQAKRKRAVRPPLAARARASCAQFARRN